MTSIVWFRSDLRAVDHPALDHARGTDSPVVGLFLLAREQWRRHDWGERRIAAVMDALVALVAELGALDIPLDVREVPTFAGAPQTVVAAARAHDADAVFFHREFEINERHRDAEVETACREAGIETQWFDDQVILAPESLRTGSDRPYSVFTPFRRRWVERVRERLPLALDDRPLRGDGPEAALETFLAERVTDYVETRNRPDLDATSRLSPALAVGAIAFSRCAAAAIAANGAHGGDVDGGHPGIDAWISELAWREFYRHVLVGFPRVSMARAFRPKTERVAWRDDDAGFEAWMRGETGYPIVDAAMRSLNETGWMHNRLRMVVAMFLTKHLLIDWRRGERYFMQQLVDGDLASNNGGWQWAASTGTDAAPYFRVFNPWTQGAKVDPEGDFVRRWVPELHHVPTKALHKQPRDGASVAPGYPEPIVEHTMARQRAIDAFGAV